MERIGQKENSFLRPYQINGAEFDNIVFYDDNGIIMETKQGWLQNGHADIKEIFVENITKRNKVNLTKKENFYTYSEEKSFYTNKKRLVLYLYADGKNIDIEILKKRHQEIGNSYNLSKHVSDYTTYVGNIGDTEFNHEVLTSFQSVEIIERAEAEKLYNSIKNDIYGVDFSNFCKIYNACKMEKRNKNLID